MRDKYQNRMADPKKRGPKPRGEWEPANIVEHTVQCVECPACKRSAPDPWRHTWGSHSKEPYKRCIYCGAVYAFSVDGKAIRRVR